MIWLMKQTITMMNNTKRVLRSLGDTYISSKFYDPTRTLATQNTLIQRNKIWYWDYTSTESLDRNTLCVCLYVQVLHSIL